MVKGLDSDDLNHRLMVYYMDPYVGVQEGTFIQTDSEDLTIKEMVTLAKSIE